MEIMEFGELILNTLATNDALESYDIYTSKEKAKQIASGLVHREMKISNINIDSACESMGISPNLVESGVESKMTRFKTKTKVYIYKNVVSVLNMIKTEDKFLRNWKSLQIGENEGLADSVIRLSLTSALTLNLSKCLRKAIAADITPEDLAKCVTDIKEAFSLISTKSYRNITLDEHANKIEKVVFTEDIKNKYNSLASAIVAFIGSGKITDELNANSLLAVMTDARNELVKAVTVVKNTIKSSDNIVNDTALTGEIFKAMSLAVKLKIHSLKECRSTYKLSKQISKSGGNESMDDIMSYLNSVSEIANESVDLLEVETSVAIESAENYLESSDMFVDAYIAEYAPKYEKIINGTESFNFKSSVSLLDHGIEASNRAESTSKVKALWDAFVKKLSGLFNKDKLAALWNKLQSKLSKMKWTKKKVKIIIVSAKDIIDKDSVKGNNAQPDESVESINRLLTNLEVGVESGDAEAEATDAEKKTMFKVIKEALVSIGKRIKGWFTAKKQKKEKAFIDNEFGGNSSESISWIKKAYNFLKTLGKTAKSPDTADDTVLESEIVD